MLTYMVIDVQKNVSALLGIALANAEPETEKSSRHQ
jgi:hypothetical protein